MLSKGGVRHACAMVRDDMELHKINKTIRDEKLAKLAAEAKKKKDAILHVCLCMVSYLAGTRPRATPTHQSTDRPAIAPGPDNTTDHPPKPYTHTLSIRNCCPNHNISN